MRLFVTRLIGLFGILLLIISGVYTAVRQQVSEALPWLVFVSSDGYLYRINADGDDFRRISFVGQTSFAPSWTSNGQWIGFLKYESQVFVHRVRHDGKDALSILKPIPLYGSMAWSPDGTSIVFHDGFNIYRARSDGSNLVKLPAPRGQKSHLSWSPDGKWLSFVLLDQPSGYNLYLMSPDGSHAFALTEGSRQNYYPVWSPDGEWLAFISNDSNFGFQLHKIRADGTERQQITHRVMVATFSRPAWSPDGKWIAFGAQNSLYDWNIYRVSSDGAVQEQLTDMRHQNRNPSWSPDGKWIAFQSYQNGASAIYRINADGSNGQQLTNAAGNARFPIWSPRTDFAWHPLLLLLIGGILFGLFRIR